MSTAEGSTNFGTATRFGLTAGVLLFAVFFVVFLVFDFVSSGSGSSTGVAASFKSF